MFYKEKYLKYKYKNSIIISEINELILNIKNSSDIIGINNDNSINTANDDNSIKSTDENNVIKNIIDILVNNIIINNSLSND